jgi:hypothetical protein
MKYKIFNDNLYCGKTCIGYVRYIDYKDNGRHGYGISRVKDHSLLKEFQDEANRLFPNAENPYIEYLDKIYG